MARKKITVEEHVAKFAAEPVEDRAKSASKLNTKQEADDLRTVLAAYHYYSSVPKDPEDPIWVYGIALERADLHRFIDAINADDLLALHGLAGLLLTNPIDIELWKAQAQHCIEHARVLYVARPNRTNAKLLEDRKREYGPQARGILKKQTMPRAHKPKK